MISDEAYVIENLFRIADKDGNDVDFVLNHVQRDLDQGLKGRDLVPKARQEGVSSYVLARFTARCLKNRNTRAVVISHDQESTQRMLRKVRYFIEEIKGPKPVIQNMSANEITFPKTNSMFYIGTAGSRKFGRGDTITNLHCSEYAFWPNPQDLMRGLLQAVPRSGEIIVESTGNGLNDYYNRCMRSAQGNSNWALHFYPWHTFPEYQVELSPEEKEDLLASLDEALEEPALLTFGLTAEQIAWRREKLEEMDYDLKSFKQEYPLTLDECFQTTGESIFHKVLYDRTEAWRHKDTHLWMLDDHPNRRYTYSLGADVSGGVGRDSSAIEVVCLETGEQVAEYNNNRIDPEQFSMVIAELGEMFNQAFVTVESNNHGVLTLATLKKIYPQGSIYVSEGVHRKEEQQLMALGHRTTSKSRPLLIGRARTALATDLVIHSPLLFSQLSTFIEHPNGKLEAQEGCFDDLVIAMAESVWGMNQAAMRANSKARRKRSRRAKSPFSLDSILDELHGRGQWPVKPQHEVIH